MKPYFIYEVTHGCNHRCPHCYNPWERGSGANGQELQVDNFSRILDSLQDEVPISGVTLTGGEPLLRKDIVELGRELGHRSIPWGMASNGSLLTEELLNGLLQAGLDYFELSLNSLKPNIYQCLAGVNNLRRNKDALLLLKQTDLKLRVSVLVNPLNLHELQDILDYCSVFGVGSVALLTHVPAPEKLNPQMDLSPEDFRAALALASTYVKNYGINISCPIPLAESSELERDFPLISFGKCVAGSKKWAIDPWGNLRICEQNFKVLGNLLERSFSALLNNWPMPRFTSCQNCNNRGAFKTQQAQQRIINP